MTNEKYNKLLFDLWEKHFGPEENIYVPLIFSPLKENGLLFIGANPSFSPEGFRRILKDTGHSSLDPQTFFHWSNRSLLDFKTAMEIETFAKEKYPYFA